MVRMSKAGAFKKGGSSTATMGKFIMLGVAGILAAMACIWVTTLQSVNESTENTKLRNQMAAASMTNPQTTAGTTNHNQGVRKIASAGGGGLDSSLDQTANRNQLKAWRANIRQKCSEAKTAEDVAEVSKINKVGFRMPSSSSSSSAAAAPVIRRCRNVVMDFGANIGDTSGHVLESGFLGCDRSKDIPGSAVVPAPHFNMATKILEDPPRNRRNVLTENLVKLMSNFGPSVGPEDYCYYGIEGNPHFTKRLSELERYVMDIRPRPIQHMHFFTESVGAGQDGMTKLYLDTVNTKQNFWGSSIFKDHQDVRKSNQNATSTSTLIAADVMGYTIGTLMRKTLAAFDPQASESDKKGGHFVLKVDIEGGEYPLLHQAAAEGTLCEYVKMGNQADLYIEYHSQKVTGKHDLAGEKKNDKKKLQDCGVTFRNLAAWWA